MNGMFYTPTDDEADSYQDGDVDKFFGCWPEVQLSPKEAALLEHVIAEVPINVIEMAMKHKAKVGQLTEAACLDAAKTARAARILSSLEESAIQ